MHVYFKPKILGQGFQMLEHEQDRHTDRDRQTTHDQHITTTAFARGNNVQENSNQ